MNANQARDQRVIAADWTAAFHSAADLLRDYQPPTSPASAGCLFVAGDVPRPLGETVALRIEFPRLQGSFVLRGTVVWRRLCGRARGLRPGVGIAIAPEERVSLRELLVRAMAASDLDRHRSRSSVARAASAERGAPQSAPAVIEASGIDDRAVVAPRRRPIAVLR